MQKELLKETETKDVAIIDEETIKDKIYIIRDQQVMLDYELAELYGYTTKAFNQQVKNNTEKFPSDFIFQLNKSEIEMISRSKKLTTIMQVPGVKGGRVYLPYAFTEQGIYMLMTVLKGELAVQQSIRLIRAFKAMKDYIVQSHLLETKEIIELVDRVNKNEKKISKLEKNDKTICTKLEKVMEYFDDPSTHKEYLIKDNRRIEASLAFREIFKEAKQSIVVIDFNTDNYHLYHSGASIKDSGARFSTITRLNDKEQYVSLINKLLMD